MTVLRARSVSARLRSESGGTLPAPAGQKFLTLLMILSLGNMPGSVHTREGDRAPETRAAATLEDEFARRPLFLPPANTVPSPAPGTLARAGRLREREVFGFAPYWSLDDSSDFDVRGFTTIAYFGVNVARDGSIIRTDNGWRGYQSQALADLISRAHAASVRVVLTVKSFKADVLHALASDPRAQARAATETLALVREKRFDGANLDFEGFGTADRAGLPRFVATVARAVHAAGPAMQVTVDTYASSADDENGFYDVRALEPSVDAFFVMGYDMYTQGAASPNAPLPRYRSSIERYVATVSARKVILGTPFYGYDWPTEDGSPRSRAVGPPTAVTYEAIAASGWPRYWDPVAQVPWTAYRVDGQWHEVYYDDPSSIALKARLAHDYGLRGTGAWALGMNGGDASMVRALTGRVARLLTGPNGPSVTTPSSRTSAPRPSGSSKPRTSSPPPTQTSPPPSSSPSASTSPSATPLPVPLPSL